MKIIIRHGMSAKDFQVGKKYYSQSTIPDDTRYECVYIGEKLVVFLFEYQGMDRTHTAYYSDMKAEDWVLRLPNKEQV